MTKAHQLLDKAANHLQEFISCITDDDDDTCSLSACRALIIAVADYTIAIATERKLENLRQESHDRPQEPPKTGD